MQIDYDQEIHYKLQRQNCNLQRVIELDFFEWYSSLMSPVEKIYCNRVAIVNSLITVHQSDCTTQRLHSHPKNVWNAFVLFLGYCIFSSPL